VAEEPARDAIEPASAREAIELSESRRGTHLQAEMGLPEGFIPPSAALAPPPVEPMNAPSANLSDTIQTAGSEE
jgi:hypothetical protein